MCSFLIYNLSLASVVTRVALLLGIMTIFLLSLKTDQKSPSTKDALEGASIVQLNEDSQKVFRFLKKRSFKQKIDINIQGYQRMGEVDETDAKTSETDFVFTDENQKKKVLRLTTKIFRFVTQGSRYYVVFVSEDPQKNIRVLEVFLVKSFPKLSGKSFLYYYTSVKERSS